MLLNTSGLMNYLDMTDSHHIQAHQFFHAAFTRLTHSYVLAELIALATARRIARPMTLAFVRHLQDSPLVEVIWVDRDLHMRALDLLDMRLDKTYSLCAAISFLLMHERGLTDALTTDRHFEQAGFRRLLVM